MALLGVVAVIAVSCSGGGDDDDATIPSGNGPARPPASPMAPDGPVRGVLLGDEIVDGAISGQRLAFTTDDTKATAFIPIGNAAADGSTLTVAWYQGFGDRRERLFTHRIDVAAGDVAYSEGVASKGLAPGLYEIEASLGDHRVRTPWIVQRVDAPAQPKAGRGRSESTLEDWEVPTSGESGSTDWDWTAPSPPSAPLTTCEVDSILAGMSPMTDVTASVFGVGPCTEFTLAATVSGTPQVIGSSDSLEGPISSLHASTDVCGLPGGSDLPGTVVHLELTGSATVAEDYTLPDLGAVLVVGLETTPARSAHVDPGDRIGIRALAMQMPPSQGVKVLYVDDGSELVESVGNVSGADRPIPCDVGRHIAFLEDRYTVPDDPPPVVQLCASAEAFGGTTASDCATFFTQDGQRWTGTVRARHTGEACEGDEDGTISLQVAGADVVGSFEASGSYTCEGIVVPTGGSTTLSGTLNDEGFALALDVPLQGTLLGSIACLNGVAFTMPVTDDTATAHYSFTAPSGDTYTCDFEVHPER